MILKAKAARLKRKHDVIFLRRKVLKQPKLMHGVSHQDGGCQQGEVGRKDAKRL